MKKVTIKKILLNITLIPLWIGIALMIIFSDATPAQSATPDNLKPNVPVMPEPGWVSPIQLDYLNLQKASSEYATHYILVDRQINIIGQQICKYKRLVMKPISQESLEALSQVKISFNPHFEKLIIHKIDVIRDGKTIHKLDAQNIKLIQMEKDIDRQIYDGQLTALIILDDIRLNDIIDYSYSIQGSNPVFGKKYSQFFELGWIVPVEQTHIRLLTPSSRTLFFKTIKSDIKPEKKQTGNIIEYQWHLTSTPPVTDEKDYPTRYSPFPELQISEYESWATVARWATSLYNVDGQQDPLVTRVAAEIEKQAPTPEEKILLALRYVQENVRYFGIEIGQNSHLPSPPGEVLKKRYGDCKDKALLLCALLKQMGIKSYPALVSTSCQQGISDWLASPKAFNHVIVYTRIKDKDYWLDATALYQKGTLETQSFIDYGTALVVDDATKELKPMIRPKDQIPEIKIEETFSVGKFHEPVTMTIKETYTFGRAEYQREYFKENALALIEKNFLNYYARKYPNIERIGHIKVEDDKALNQMVVTDAYSIPDFWKRQHHAIYFQFYSSYIGSQIALPHTLNRKGPLAVNYPIKISHRIDLNLPKHKKINSPDDNLTIEDPAVLYERKIKYNGQSVTIIHNYETRSNEVSPQDVAKHILNLRAIDDAIYVSSKVPGIPYPAKRLALKKTMTKKVVIIK